MEAPGGFSDKWRARWPEWDSAEVFVPAAQRDVVVAWFALLQELADAAWGGADPTPGLAKLAWWQEELRGWSRGARRHPLGAALQSRAADWGDFANALSMLRDRDALAAGPVEWLRALSPFADGIAAVESRLWPGSGVPRAVDALGPLWPGGGDAERAVLAGAWGGRAHGARARRLWSALAQARLRTSTPSRWRTLLLAWRSARD